MMMMMMIYTKQNPSYNLTYKILLNFEIQTEQNSGQQTRPDVKKKIIFTIVDSAVKPDHTVNMKESEKINTYLVLAKEQKKLCSQFLLERFRKFNSLRSVAIVEH